MTEKPPQLAELQDWLRWAFTEPAGPAAALAGKRSPLRRRDEPRPRRLAWLEGGASAVRRLAVYSDAYFLRLEEALLADHPALRRTLGAEGFRRLAADYLCAHPSNSPNIGDAGAALPAFLERHPLARKRPYLPDLARLEREVLASIYSERMTPLDPASLAGAGPEDWAKARLLLDPTVRLLETGWPVDGLWRGRARAPSRARRRHLLIHRDEGFVRVRAIGPAERAALERFRKGASMAQACAGLPQRQAPSLKRWLSGWVSSGVVRRVIFPAPSRAL